FDSVLNLSGNGNAFYSESELLQNEFKELLYELYEQGCKNRKSQPGLINRAIAPLYKRKLQDLINRYKSEDVKNLTPEAKSNRIDFEECDLLSQLVLFAFIGINNYWQEIEYEEICSILYDKVFNQTIAKSYLINEKNLRDSFRILIQKKLVNDEKNIYSVKEDVIRFCILSNAENKELSKEFLKVRDELISKNTKIDYTIQNGFFEEYKKFIQEYDDKEGINHFLIQCVQYDKGIEYLQPLVDKGINPDYLDQDGQSPLDVLWVRDTNLKVMEFLLAQGFKFRNKIPCHDRAGNKFSYSPLVLVSDKCNPKWVKIILKNHIYEDINDYEFQGRFTALQLYVIGSSLEAVSLLIQAGADFLLNTKDGWSLLILAVMNDKHPEILEYLLKNGFHGEFHYKDDKGKTAMDYAKQIKNQKAIELLEKYEKLQNNS
ncbi:MAG: ankyrin repeat domain-containing protein, partial [Treponema sp.]|nr:ankyrin repeat domain-containing protein [Treponema sp.]